MNRHLIKSIRPLQIFTVFRNFATLSNQRRITILRKSNIVQTKRIFSTVSKYSFDETQTKLADPIQESVQSHKSNAQELVSKIPVIQVDTNTVRCRGVNQLALGHPVVYIQVMGKYPHIPGKCKWCGLRYIKRGYLNKQ